MYIYIYIYIYICICITSDKIWQSLFIGETPVCNFSDKSKLINKRLDLVSKCRNENKYMLKNYSGVT